MTDINSITPSLELIEQWRCEPQYVTAEQAGRYLQMVSMAYDRFVELMERSARYGADQELEALLTWLRVHNLDNLANDLLAARHPKPLSLKELALAELELLRGDANAHGLGFDAPAIRQALELIND